MSEQNIAATDSIFPWRSSTRCSKPNN